MEKCLQRYSTGAFCVLGRRSESATNISLDSESVLRNAIVLRITYYAIQDPWGAFCVCGMFRGHSTEYNSRGSESNPTKAENYAEKATKE